MISAWPGHMGLIVNWLFDGQDYPNPPLSEIPGIVAADDDALLYQSITVW